MDYRDYTRPTAITLLFILGNGYRTLDQLQALFPEIAVPAYLEKLLETGKIRKVIATTYDQPTDRLIKQTKYTLNLTGEKNG